MESMNEINQIFSSQLPYSIERAAELLRRALKRFPELKEKFLKGSPDEKKQARKFAAEMISIIDTEIRKTCEVLDLRMNTFEAALASYFSPQELFLFKEARETVLRHHDELFPQRTASSKARPSKPIIRC